MRRNKIKLGFIAKDSARKASFNKRKRGFMKKVHELSTLCGIQACAVVYSKFDSQPTVYPSPMEARQILTRYMEQPDMERSRFKENLRSLTRQRIEKAKKKLRRLQRDNKRKQLTMFMFQCLEGKADLRDFDPRDAGEMRAVIDELLGKINERMEKLKAAGLDKMDNDAPALAPAEAAVAVAVAQPNVVEEITPLPAEDGADMEDFYLGMLMSPTDDTADFGWTDDTVMLPPSVDDDPDAALLPLFPSAPPPVTGPPAEHDS